MKSLSLSVIVTVFLTLISSHSFAASADCGCDRNSISSQTETLRKIAKHAGQRRTVKAPGPEDWPSSLDSGQASNYYGTPDYAAKHRLIFWVATPERLHVPKGICVLITNKEHPERKVRAMTADVGGWKTPHRVVDLSQSTARVLIPNYIPGKSNAEVTIQPIACGRQS